MRIMIVTNNKQFPLTMSFVTFLLCALMVLSCGAWLLGVLLQLLAQLSPFLMLSGITLLKCSGAVFLISRVTLWSWRLMGRRLWASIFPYRYTLVYSVRPHLRTLAQWLTQFLFQ